VIYVDDVGIVNSNQADLDKLFATLTEKGFTFTKEGTFEAFLGIKFERNLEKALSRSLKRASSRISRKLVPE
jgi:hypothetical protein